MPSVKEAERGGIASEAHIGCEVLDDYLQAGRFPHAWELASGFRRIAFSDFETLRKVVEMTDKRLTLTVEQAGRLLGISRGLAYEAVRTGQLPSVRFGKRILVPRAALEKKLAEAVQGGSK